MDIVNLSCNKCGAPLEVPGVANFATCSYCGSRLAIHKSGSVVYSEVLSSIDTKASQIVEHLETLVDLQSRGTKRRRRTPDASCEIVWRTIGKGLIEMVAFAKADEGEYEAAVSKPLKYNLRSAGWGKMIPRETPGHGHTPAEWAEAQAALDGKAS